MILLSEISGLSTDTSTQGLLLLLLLLLLVLLTYCCCIDTDDGDNTEEDGDGDGTVIEDEEERRIIFIGEVACDRVSLVSVVSLGEGRCTTGTGIAVTGMTDRMLLLIFSNTV